MIGFLIIAFAIMYWILQTVDHGLLSKLDPRLVYIANAFD